MNHLADYASLKVQLWLVLAPLVPGRVEEVLPKLNLETWKHVGHKPLALAE
jgi:hypothetical protein